MQVGDLVKVKKGRFMENRLGIILKYNPDAKGQARWFVQLIGNNVPTTLKHRPILYRPVRLIAIKSSSSQGQ